MWDCGSQLTEKENRDFSRSGSLRHCLVPISTPAAFAFLYGVLCCRMLYYKMASFSLDLSWICCYKMKTVFPILREAKWELKHEPGVRNQSWGQLNAAYWLALLCKPTGIYSGLGPPMPIINQKLIKKLQRHFLSWEFFSLNDSSLYQVDIKTNQHNQALALYDPEQAKDMLILETKRPK